LHLFSLTLVSLFVLRLSCEFLPAARVLSPRSDQDHFIGLAVSNLSPFLAGGPRSVDSPLSPFPRSPDGVGPLDFLFFFRLLGRCRNKGAWPGPAFRNLNIFLYLTSVVFVLVFYFLACPFKNGFPFPFFWQAFIFIHLRPSVCQHYPPCFPLRFSVHFDTLCPLGHFGRRKAPYLAHE